MACRCQGRGAGRKSLESSSESTSQDQCRACHCLESHVFRGATCEVEDMVSSGALHVQHVEQRPGLDHSNLNATSPTLVAAAIRAGAVVLTRSRSPIEKATGATNGELRRATSPTLEPVVGYMESVWCGSHGWIVWIPPKQNLARPHAVSPVAGSRGVAWQLLAVAIGVPSMPTSAHVYICLPRERNDQA